MKPTKEIKKFIKEESWTFAKTYAKTWPHEYIVQERVDNDLYLKLANFIDNYGYEDFFYSIAQTYYDYEGFTYWHMENIINRCIIPDTYHRRKIDGRLPKPN